MGLHVNEEISKKMIIYLFFLRTKNTSIYIIIRR